MSTFLIGRPAGACSQMIASCELHSGNIFSADCSYEDSNYENFPSSKMPQSLESAGT